MSAPLCMPEDWAAYIKRTTPLAVEPPAPCFRCGTPRVADDELHVFYLCPSCSTGSLRPANREAATC